MFNIIECLNCGQSLSETIVYCGNYVKVVITSSYYLFLFVDFSLRYF